MSAKAIEEAVARAMRAAMQAEHDWLQRCARKHFPPPIVTKFKTRKKAKQVSAWLKSEGWNKICKPNGRTELWKGDVPVEWLEITAAAGEIRVRASV